MTNALELTGLTKSYDSFKLQDLNLTLPQGSILGFVGENGAGKSTTIRLMLGLARRDVGEIRIFGKDLDTHAQEIKQDIGVVFDDLYAAEVLSARDLGVTLSHVYRNWDKQEYHRLLEKFSLPEKKTVKDLSRGMRMKLALALALSHHAKLLILDEPTSGLDPVVRDEILDVFLDFIQDEEHTIFFSSHITSDLEKVADYIAFLHKGKLLLSQEKDILLERFGLLKCSAEELAALPPEAIVGVRRGQFGVEALAERKLLPSGRHLMLDPAGIEDIMLFYIKGKEVR